MPLYKIVIPLRIVGLEEVLNILVDYKSKDDQTLFLNPTAAWVLYRFLTTLKMIGNLAISTKLTNLRLLDISNELPDPVSLSRNIYKGVRYLSRSRKWDKPEKLLMSFYLYDRYLSKYNDALQDVRVLLKDVDDFYRLAEEFIAPYQRISLLLARPLTLAGIGAGDKCRTSFVYAH